MLTLGYDDPAGKEDKINILDVHVRKENNKENNRIQYIFCCKVSAAGNVL